MFRNLHELFRENLRRHLDDQPLLNQVDPGRGVLTCSSMPTPTWPVATTARFPTHPTGVASDWWRHGGDVDELIGELDGAGVERCVVVQAVGAYGHDCRVRGRGGGRPPGAGSPW